MSSYVLLCHLMSSYVILCHLMSLVKVVCEVNSQNACKCVHDTLAEYCPIQCGMVCLCMCMLHQPCGIAFVNCCVTKSFRLLQVMYELGSDQGESACVVVMDAALPRAITPSAHAVRVLETSVAKCCKVRQRDPLPKAWHDSTGKGNQDLKMF